MSIARQVTDSFIPGRSNNNPLRRQPPRDEGAELRAVAIRQLQAYRPDSALELLPTLERLNRMCRQDVGVSEPDSVGRAAEADTNGQVRLVPLSRVVKEHILRVYEAMGRNKTRAAHVLEIDIKTLYNKLKRYGQQ